jgi:hypothetical protein
MLLYNFSVLWTMEYLHLFMLSQLSGPCTNLLLKVGVTRKASWRSFFTYYMHPSFPGLSIVIRSMSFCATVSLIFHLAHWLAILIVYFCVSLLMSSFAVRIHSFHRQELCYLLLMVFPSRSAVCNVLCLVNLCVVSDCINRGSWVWIKY